LLPAIAGFKARIARDVFIHHTGGQTFKGAGIDWQARMEQNWKLFKRKWGLPEDMSYEQGYHMSLQSPDLSQYLVSLSDDYLLSTHETDNRERIWEEKDDQKQGRPPTDSTITKPGVLPERPKLSVCMIVRDEEQMLPRCLNSLEKIADELIIVDTGSKDTTISRAKDFGAKIYELEWCDDFSAARNEAIKHATGEWILQMDADEELLPESEKLLRKMMRNPWALLYMIYIDNGPTYSERFFKSARLFRNHPQIKYSRAYHETIRQSADNILASEAGWKIVYEPKLVLRHYGYETSEIKERGKLDRELRILESHMQDNPDDQSMAIRLAEVYKHTGQYDKALGICKKALEANPDYAAAYHILGTVYFEQGNLDGAIVQYAKALTIDTNQPWVHYHLGAAYRDKGNTDKAIDEFNKALSRDAGLGKVHTALGAALHEKGMLDKAFQEYLKALQINPKDAEAHFNLGIIFRSRGMPDKAIKAYKNAISSDPSLAEAYNNLAIVYFMNKEYSAAVKYCDKAVVKGFQVHPQFLKDLEPYRKQRSSAKP